MVGVFALMTPDAVKNATAPYQWTCKLNGIPTPPVVLASITIPTTIKICSKDGLEDGEYLLEFSFNSGTGPQVLFDYLEYIPSISVTPQTYNFVGVSADEASIAYSTAWTRKTLPDGTSGVQAVEMIGQQMNCSVQYQFTGLLLPSFKCLMLKYIIRFISNVDRLVGDWSDGERLVYIRWSDSHHNIFAKFTYRKLESRAWTNPLSKLIT